MRTGGKSLATKTISIDLEAYRRLTRVRRENESFNQAIKRVVRPPLDVEAFLKELDKVSMSPRAVAALEGHLRRRHRPSNRAR
ncbi:MAG: hypothetical protein HYX75_24320 [Acidobacteria bacterium]|nr:hypothetical protein [Acidobacteriota bacterium]